MFLWLMYNISNFPLNSSLMQQAHYFREINYYMVKKIIVARKGVDVAPCPPPKYATDHHHHHYHHHQHHHHHASLKQPG